MIQAATQLPRPVLSLRGISKGFGQRPVLRTIDLDVAPGEFLTILGESGSGKTTLLRLVAGFENPDSGEILMDGQRLDPLPPYKRQVNTVFQSYALFPHLSVFENVAYGLRLKKLSKEEIRHRVGEALAMANLGSFAAQAPACLSGGQQQRVALARALVNQPRILLLDEPLSALDANLRRQMQSELKSIQHDVGITFLFVTHDQDEAMALSDRIALLRSGQIEQLAAPREIYTHPATSYSARFIGQTNFMRAEITNGLARAGEISWASSLPDGKVLFSIRPECLHILAQRQSLSAELSEFAFSRFRAKIVAQSFGGASDSIEILCGDGQRFRVRAPNPGPLSGELEFSFLPSDAVPVRNTEAP